MSDSTKALREKTFGVKLKPVAPQARPAPAPSAFQQNLSAARSNLKPASPKAEAPSGGHFIVSPHDDVNNLFANSVGMSAHKASKNKEMLTPIFKDHNQRAAFHKQAASELSTLSAMAPHTAKDQHKETALRHLVDKSSLPNAKLTFDQVPNTQPRVYVQGHGGAGKTSISSDKKQAVTAKDTADMLDSMHLPSTSQVRTNSCWSGADKAFSKADALKKQDSFLGKAPGKSLSSFVKKPETTFSHALFHELEKQGRPVSVRGYLGPTLQAATKVTSADGSKVQGMGVRIGDKGSKHIYALRSQASIDYIPPPQPKKK